MTYVVSLSLEVDAESPEAAAQAFVETIEEGGVDDLLFQVVADSGERVFVQPESGRVMDALEVLADLRDWYDTSEGSPLSL